MADALKLKVENVTCGHCVRTIERELSLLEGVSDVSATPEGEVELRIDERKTDREKVDALLAEIGYPVAG